MAVAAELKQKFGAIMAASEHLEASIEVPKKQSDSAVSPVSTASLLRGLPLEVEKGGGGGKRGNGSGGNIHYNTI